MRHKIHKYNIKDLDDTIYGLINRMAEKFERENAQKQIEVDDTDSIDSETSLETHTQEV